VFNWGFRLLQRRARDGIHRERVGSVDANALDAVSVGLLSERLTRGLAFSGNRDRPLVVVTDEHRRNVEDAREVESLVEIALARCAVAEMTEYSSVFCAL